MDEQLGYRISVAITTTRQQEGQGVAILFLVAILMLATLLGIALDTTGRIAMQSNAGWGMLVRAHVHMPNVIIVGGECGWIR